MGMWQRHAQIRTRVTPAHPDSPLAVFLFNWWADVRKGTWEIKHKLFSKLNLANMSQRISGPITAADCWLPWLCWDLESEGLARVTSKGVPSPLSTVSGPGAPWYHLRAALASNARGTRIQKALGLEIAWEISKPWRLRLGKTKEFQNHRRTVQVKSQISI